MSAIKTEINDQKCGFVYLFCITSILLNNKQRLWGFNLDVSLSICARSSVPRELTRFTSKIMLKLVQ